MLDITGEKYGKLTAVRNTGRVNNQNNYIWEFLCDCGNTVERATGNIRHRQTGQCPKCAKEAYKSPNLKHGRSKSKAYKSWLKIKERCFDEDSKDFYLYGGKGITMQGDWVHDFDAFYNHIGTPPENTRYWSVDRIDYSNGYVEGNVRWATQHQQARNRGKMKSNKSGITGVHWDRKLHRNGKSHTLYCVAVWHDPSSGKQKRKHFNANKLGKDAAFESAKAYRESIIGNLNNMGAGYSPKHGK